MDKNKSFNLIYLLLIPYAIFSKDTVLTIAITIYIIIDIILTILFNRLNNRNKIFIIKITEIRNNRFYAYEHQVLDDLLKAIRLGQPGISVPVPEYIRENKVLVEKFVNDLKELGFRCYIHGVQAYIEEVRK